MDIADLEQRHGPGSVLLEELVVRICRCKHLDFVAFRSLELDCRFLSKFTASPIVSRSKLTISQ
jgi:hypothetical protein